MARILVVDDTPSVRLTLEFCLQLDGHGVALAADGRTALQIAAGQKIDLIILDVNMPGMNGFAVCQALKSNPAVRHIPVVMMTSIPTSAIVSKALACGAAEMLSKPFDLKQFQALVARNLAGRPRSLEAPVLFPQGETGPKERSNGMQALGSGA